jgi:hypothetical protein
MIIVPSFWIMTLRTVEGKLFSSHDGGILQTEAAIEMILEGKNPYTADYASNESMRQYSQQSNIREPLFHNPYMPASFLLPVPLYLLGNYIFGDYDHHIFYILCFIGILLLARNASKGENRLALLAGVGFNPGSAYFLNMGRNDYVILLGLLLIPLLIEKKRSLSAGFVFGIVCAYKQLAWFAAPFIWLYMHPLIDKRKQIIFITGAGVVFFAFVLPFAFWDFPSFYDDVFAFNAGNSEISYPLGGTPGYGAANLVLYWDLVNSRNDYFPFWIPTLIFGVPLIIFLLILQYRNNTRNYFFVSIAVSLFGISYFSRFFHDNYIVLIAQLLLFAAFSSPQSESKN